MKESVHENETEKSPVQTRVMYHSELRVHFKLQLIPEFEFKAGIIE